MLRALDQERRLGPSGSSELLLWEGGWARGAISPGQTYSSFRTDGEGRRAALDTSARVRQPHPHEPGIWGAVDVRGLGYSETRCGKAN